MSKQTADFAACPVCGASGTRRGHRRRCEFQLLRLKLLRGRTVEDVEELWREALAGAGIGIKAGCIERASEGQLKALREELAANIDE